ncbi:hypothetical protein Nepgr_004998 [Nepenthes gracilis]|uniref:Uncharacterized protein n=1 Tax=Nepenthes gracilis TaxID=150966 RepID=A0AAD3S2V4_NEPGR|nr:hypothetical protein Nepgr_004998 [Nepenthes gracilis]
MGTKLQHATAINVLLVANNSSVGNCVNVCSSVYICIMANKALKDDEDSGRIQTRDSMDRILEQRSVESIRKTMLIHEDIFHHQVRELHRLYSVQKMLMEELRIKSKPSEGDDEAAGPSTRTDRMDEECGLDLTLSMGFGDGGNTSKDKSRSMNPCWESSSSNHNNNGRDRGGGGGGGGEDCNATSSSSATDDQQTKRPLHWLFRGWT